MEDVTKINDTSVDELLSQYPNLKSIDWELFPHILDYTQVVKRSVRPLLGRDSEIQSIAASMCRPELKNVILLGDAGSGKTALVQGLRTKDNFNYYLEVNLPKMIEGDDGAIAERMKSLFDECGKLSNALRDPANGKGPSVVLFVDEFHQVVQLSDVMVEVLKPLLADSGTRNIRLITATTFAEFQEFILPNQPLVERLQRINISQPPKEVVISILKGLTESSGYSSSVRNESIFELIYEYTNRYVPANSQPRKSILILDNMLGWHIATKQPLDKQLLAKVIYETEGVNVSFKVDTDTISSRLNEKVFNQELAVWAIDNRLQVCVADLHRKGKPMSSFLFTGSTGVGKTEMVKQLSTVLFDDAKRLIRFDMSEYSQENSLDRFRETLTQRVWERPFSIVLLDEIEKAHMSVTRLLLQVLDDGRLSNKVGREVSFQNSYIVLTTNEGNEVYKEISNFNVDSDGNSKSIKRYESLIYKHLREGNTFPPELLGRMDAVIPFTPLPPSVVRKIAESQMKKVIEEAMMKHSIGVTYDKRVIDYITNDKNSGDSDSGGARQVLRNLDTEVVSVLSKFINENVSARRARIEIDGNLVSENKSLLESDARVVVKKIN